MARPSGSSSRRLLRRRSLLEEKQWTLLEEWAYVIPYGSSTVRNEFYRLTCGSITAASATWPWVVSPLSSGLISCWHEQPGGKAQLSGGRILLQHSHERAFQARQVILDRIPENQLIHGFVHMDDSVPCSNNAA